MLREPALQQFEIEMVTLEELVPQDHLLRKIDKFISFGFIRNKVRHCYCQGNGRPAIVRCPDKIGQSRICSGLIIPDTILGGTVATMT